MLNTSANFPMLPMTWMKGHDYRTDRFVDSRHSLHHSVDPGIDVKNVSLLCRHDTNIERGWSPEGDAEYGGGWRIGSR